MSQAVDTVICGERPSTSLFSIFHWFHNCPIVHLKLRMIVKSKGCTREVGLHLPGISPTLEHPLHGRALADVGAQGTCPKSGGMGSCVPQMVWDSHSTKKAAFANLPNLFVNPLLSQHREPVARQFMVHLLGDPGKFAFSPPRSHRRSHYEAHTMTCQTLVTNHLRCSKR